MELSMIKRYSHHLFLLLVVLLGFPVLSWSQTASSKVLFDGIKIIAPWKATTSEDASSQQVSGGIQFTLEAWQTGRDMWPRFQLSGAGIDLSDYSMVEVEIENPTDHAENITLSVNETTPRRVTQGVSLPPRTTVTAKLNISDGAVMDQSNITRVVCYLSRPLTESTFIIKNVTAILNPDYISARTALGQRVGETLRVATHFSQEVKLDGDNAVRWKKIRQLMDSAKAAFDQQKPGYLTIARDQLDTAQHDMAQLGMNLRNADFLIWTSPLGLAIRGGTLPQPGDKALSAINQEICLNEYQPICINVSAAAKAQTVQVVLDKNATPDNLISLRPTLFSKARDGSQTADAIGLPTDSLSLKVEPYQTQQFIVWVNTKNKTLQAKTYNAKIQLTINGNTKNIPVNLNIVNIKLPQIFPVNVINWAYFYMPQVTVTKGLEKEAVANLRDYGVNTWIINYDQMPLPLLDESGKYIGLNAKDRNRVERLHQVMDLLKGNPNETFILWFGFQRPQVRELLSKPGVLKGYLKDLHSLMDEYHVPIDKRYISLWDEPRLDQVTEGIKWMQEIHALDPSWNFYDDNSYPPVDENQLREYASLVKLWLPNWDGFYQGHPQQVKQLEMLKTSGLGFYRCLMSRNNRGVNIYEYYQLMSWHLMQNGLDAMGFWTYNSGAGEDAWDGTTGKASGGVVVYNKDGKLFTSRRWELFREGIEAYKLAQMAFGDESVLDAKKNPALANLCQQITDHPEDFGEAGGVREKLIDLALKRSSR
jgi:hypothetical protein